MGKIRALVAAVAALFVLSVGALASGASDDGQVTEVASGAPARPARAATTTTVAETTTTLAPATTTTAASEPAPVTAPPTTTKPAPKPAAARKAPATSPTTAAGPPAAPQADASQRTFEMSTSVPVVAGVGVQAHGGGCKGEGFAVLAEVYSVNPADETVYSDGLAEPRPDGSWVIELPTGGMPSGTYEVWVICVDVINEELVFEYPEQPLTIA